MRETPGKKLQAESIRAAVVTASGRDIDIVVHDCVDSTNTWSLQQCKAGKALPFACFAEEQTSGRGRRGKEWVMNAGNNIAMSLSWPFALLHQHIHLLPLSISIAVVATLEALKLDDVQVKWPNDVYVRGRKIAGILIETQPLGKDQVDAACADTDYVAAVIGIGLNYDMSVSGHDRSPELPVLTDICHELESVQGEEMPHRSCVASLLLQQVVEVCQSFQQGAEQNLETFRARYDFCKDKSVEIILDNGDRRAGVARGVNDNAELLVMIDGKQHAFNSAQVSVKAS
jgi:BirA family biotin operon repressor/biotin-[acetyl-CoA-carboxylase] ligase